MENSNSDRHFNKIVSARPLSLLDDADIVISGIGGRYPEADNLDEFWENLVTGQETVTMDDRRGPIGKFKLLAIL